MSALIRVLVDGSCFWALLSTGVSFQDAGSFTKTTKKVEILVHEKTFICSTHIHSLVIDCTRLQCQRYYVRVNIAFQRSRIECTRIDSKRG